MRKHILSIPIDWLSPEELEKKLIGFVKSDKPHQIATINPEFIVLSRSNERFRQSLLQADLNLADGTGIVLAQSLNDQKSSKSSFVRLLQFCTLGFSYLLTPEKFPYKRVTGVDLSDMLMALSAKHGWRVYLLGAMPGVAQKAGEIWQAKYSGLQIVGASSADPDIKTARTVGKAKPDILLVAYGAPKQDIFISEFKHELDAKIMVGVGGTFDYAVGNIYRAPSWIRRLGLEWLVRLIQQPKRFKRIWRSTVGFTNLIITNPR